MNCYPQTNRCLIRSSNLAPVTFFDPAFPLVVDVKTGTLPVVPVLTTASGCSSCLWNWHVSPR